MFKNYFLLTFVIQVQTFFISERYDSFLCSNQILWCWISNWIFDWNVCIVVLPRYVRVNLLKTRVEDVLEIFQKDGYSILTSDEAIKYLPHEFPSKKSLKRQPDINSLLLFPPTTTFFDHHLFKSGQIILQDKVCWLPFKNKNTLFEFVELKNIAFFVLNK